MARGTDQRIELELAVFSLTQPEAVPVALPAAVPARPVVTAASPAPFAAVPQQVPPVQMASAPCRLWQPSRFRLPWNSRRSAHP